MSLEKFNALVDPKLAAEYDKEPFNPTAARKPLLKQVASIRKSYENGKGFRKPRGGGEPWASVRNNVVAFNPTHNGANLLPERALIPSERFGEALKHFEDAIHAGAFDMHIEGVAPTAPAKRGRKPKSV